MTSREVTGVALKCAAVYLLFSGLIAIPIVTYSVYSMANQNGSASPTWSIIIGVISSITFGVAAIILWKVSNSLISKIVESDEPTKITGLTVRQVEVCLFRSLGLYFAIINLKPLVVSVIRNLHYVQEISNPKLIIWLEPMAQLAVIGLSVLLLCNPEIVLNHLDKYRSKNEEQVW